MKVSPKSLVVVRLDNKNETTGYFCGTTVPSEKLLAETNVNYLDADGEPKAHRVFSRGGFFVGSMGSRINHYLRVWDGKPKSYNHCD